jgi:hypothetical protein
MVIVRGGGSHLLTLQAWQVLHFSFESAQLAHRFMSRYLSPGMQPETQKYCPVHIFGRCSDEFRTTGLILLIENESAFCAGAEK